MSGTALNTPTTDLQQFTTNTNQSNFDLDFLGVLNAGTILFIRTTAPNQPVRTQIVIERVESSSTYVTQNTVNNFVNPATTSTEFLSINKITQTGIQSLTGSGSAFYTLTAAQIASDFNLVQSGSAISYTPSANSSQAFNFFTNEVGTYEIRMDYTSNSISTSNFAYMDIYNFTDGVVINSQNSQNAINGNRQFNLSAIWEHLTPG